MPYLLVAPAIILLITFRLIPLLMVSGMSLYDVNFMDPARFVGLNNYRDIFSDPKLYQPIANTWWYVLCIVPASVVLSLSIAMVAGRAGNRAQHAVRFIFYVPSLVTGIVMASIWKWVFHYDGIVNWLFAREVLWFSNRALSVGPISFISIMGSTGFYVIIFLAALKAIPESHYEAAYLEGATPGQQRRRITIPQLLPSIGVVVLLLSAGTLQIWGLVYRLAPYPYAATMVYAMWKESFLYGRFGVGSAYSVVLMVITVALVLVQRKVRR